MRYFRNKNILCTDMKKNEVDDLVEVLADTGSVRNDGDGKIYIQDERTKVWQRYGKRKERQKLSQILKDKGYAITRSDSERLQREVEESLYFMDETLSDTTPTNIIRTQNGVVKLVTSEFTEEIDESVKYKNQLNFNYILQANLENAPEIKHFLRKSLGIDEENIEESPKFKRFLEVIVYLISDIANAKKAVMLIGPPNTGKSVFLKWLERVVGADQVIPMSFADCVKRFNGSLMEGKMLMISHEMPLKPLKCLDKLKAIISGDSLLVEQKMIQAHGHTPRVKLITAANNLPVLGEADAGGAFCDRLLIIPFAAKSVENKNSNLLEELWKERDIMLSMAVDSAKSFLGNNLNFTPEPEGDSLVEKLKHEGNSITYFITECYQEMTNGKICLADFYDRYVSFCKGDLLRPVDSTAFRVQLEQLGYRLEKRRVSSYPNPRKCILGLSAKTLNMSENLDKVA